MWVRELAVAEPFVRFYLGTVKPNVSSILPFAGDLADAKSVGITGEP